MVHRRRKPSRTAICKALLWTVLVVVGIGHGIPVGLMLWASGGNWPLAIGMLNRPPAFIIVTVSLWAGVVVDAAVSGRGRGLVWWIRAVAVALLLAWALLYRLSLPPRALPALLDLVFQGGCAVTLTLLIFAEKVNQFDQ